MTVYFISHSDCALHEMGADHPENPARLSAIQDQLISSGLDLSLQHNYAPLATREQLYRVHDKSYVDELFLKSPEQGHAWLDPDTSMNPHTLSAALRAAGAVVYAVDLVMDGDNRTAFCNVRPPGHHAEHNRAMGFCFFNNIAVGAAHAISKHRLKRIAIVDFDVHHGNGTEDIFKDRPGVLFCSTFQHPFYPGTAFATNLEHIVNIPLPAGSDGEAFRQQVSARLLPKLDAFKPELIFVSAGFDAHSEDDMAGMCLLEQDYAWVTDEIKNIADKYSQGRIISSLEGGYALSALGRSVAAHINALI